jgi:hypothetical protein
VIDYGVIEFAHLWKSALRSARGIRTGAWHHAIHAGSDHVSRTIDGLSSFAVVNKSVLYPSQSELLSFKGDH